MEGVNSLFIEYNILGKEVTSEPIKVRDGVVVEVGQLPRPSLYEQLKDLTLMGLERTISDITSNQNKFTYKSRYKGEDYSLPENFTLSTFSKDCTERKSGDGFSSPLPVLHFTHDFKRKDIKPDFITQMKAEAAEAAKETELSEEEHQIETLLSDNESLRAELDECYDQLGTGSERSPGEVRSVNPARRAEGGGKRRRRKSKKRKYTKKRKSKKKKTRRRRRTRR